MASWKNPVDQRVPTDMVEAALADLCGQGVITRWRRSKWRRERRWLVTFSNGITRDWGIGQVQAFIEGVRKRETA